jgi:AraC-like DNA-binding protein
MDNFYCDILDQVGVFSSFITSLILFFKTTGSQRHANRLLAVVIFTWGWFVLIYLMVVWGALKNYPHLFRIGSPLYYLIAPCSYMYVRSILFDESRFRKWDWLHFLPTALHFIELTPFYLADPETKRRAVEAVTSNITLTAYRGSGLIPALWHFQLRALQGIIYLFFQWKLLSRFFNSSPARALRQFPSMKGWLISFSCLISLLCLGTIWQAVVLLTVKEPPVALHAPNSPAIIFMSLSFVWLSCYLLFKPDILYGIIRVSPVALNYPPMAMAPLGKTSTSIGIHAFGKTPASVKPSTSMETPISAKPHTYLETPASVKPPTSMETPISAKPHTYLETPTSAGSHASTEIRTSAPLHASTEMHALVEPYASGEIPVTPPPSAKTPKPPIDEYLLQEYARQIGDTIQKEGLFKRKGLTLAGLAEELSIPTHHLSYMLRHFYRQQFNDFINQYRVNYVKEIMRTEVWMKMTLEAHATDAGFSSRSTFFAVFKKQAGLTPTEYARQSEMAPLVTPDANDTP